MDQEIQGANKQAEAFFFLSKHLKKQNNWTLSFGGNADMDNQQKK